MNIEKVFIAILFSVLPLGLLFAAENQATQQTFSHSVNSEHTSTITKTGIINWTNIQRKAHGLSELKENQVLDQEAQAKVRDMFKQQYFAHINPQGEGPKELAQSFGYAYMGIAENLMQGNFVDNQSLVNSWMASSGHRANILNPKYQEIGVAVAQGFYHGRITWLAVQEFGRPIPSCAHVDPQLRSKIASLQSEVDQLQTKLKVMKNEIDANEPQTKAEFAAYNKKVSEYNEFASFINTKVNELKHDTQEYNREVEKYKSCL